MLAFAVTVCLPLGAASTMAQRPSADIRDTVNAIISRVAARAGDFGKSYALGDFAGDRRPFQLLDTLVERNADSTLVALIDCFSDSTRSRVRYMGVPITRGGLCYLMLHNLVYHGRSSEEWPGNYLTDSLADAFLPRSRHGERS